MPKGRNMWCDRSQRAAWGQSIKEHDLVGWVGRSRNGDAENFLCGLLRAFNGQETLEARLFVTTSARKLGAASSVVWCNCR